jgi:uncharacterized protein YrzB (UPF0473 family)
MASKYNGALSITFKRCPMTDKTNQNEPQSKCDDPECKCGEGSECTCEEGDIEIIELEDEDGNAEEFAILDELDFEGRHFVIMAPYAEVKALQDSAEESDEIDMSIEIYEEDGDNFTMLEDESLSKRLMDYLDTLSQEKG